MRDGLLILNCLAMAITLAWLYRLFVFAIPQELRQTRRQATDDDRRRAKIEWFISAAGRYLSR